MTHIMINSFSFIILSVLSVISLAFIGQYISDNKTKIKTFINSTGMTMQKWSDVFDRLSGLNGIVLNLFFLLNFILMIHYMTFYNGLRDEGINDGSLVLVPAFGLIVSGLLCSTHNYSTNISIEIISNLTGMVISLLCVIILFSMVPIIGIKFGILSVSADYWNLMFPIFRNIVIYLMLFSIGNFIIKSSIESDTIDG